MDPVLAAKIGVAVLTGIGTVRFLTGGLWWLVSGNTGRRRWCGGLILLLGLLWWFGGVAALGYLSGALNF